MKPITARAVGLAFALCALMGICACVWPQTAYAQDAYAAKPLGATEMLEDGYYLTLLQESNGVSYGDVSGGKIVSLEALPESIQNPVKGNITSWDDAPSPEFCCYTWPALVNSKDEAGNWAFIGDNGEAFAFVADADPANNGADGACFSVTWKKAALMRTSTATSGAGADGGTYVDIKIDFELHNTVYNPDAHTDKAVVQFHNRFDWGFWHFNVMLVDQVITFFNSETGEEFNINGKLDVLGTSMDIGEGFTVKGGISSAVSSTAPVLNTRVPGVSPNPGINANSRWSTVPGSYVYEINEDGWLGYVGAPDIYGTPDAILYRDDTNTPRTSSVHNVDNKYDSAYVFELGGQIFPTDASEEDGYESSVTYTWRSASVAVEMGGASSLEVRQYAVGYEGWPAVDVLSGVGLDGGAIKTLGHNTNNLANPSLDTMPSSGFENGGKKFYTIAFSGLYGTNPGPPQKSVADHEPHGIGDIVDFTIAQRVNTYGDNIFSPYRQFSLYDELDENLSFVSAKVFYVSPSGIENDVTAVAGNLAHDTDTGRVTFTFSKSYLQSKDTGSNIDPRAGMVYQGGRYELRLSARVQSDSQMQLTNTGFASINGEVKATEEVPVLVETARIELSKDVRFENSVGDEAVFSLTVVNTEAGSTAYDVVVQDVALPANMQVKESSLAITGAPSSLDISVVEDNQVREVTVANEASVELSGNAVRAHIPYLPAGVPVTISFAATCAPELAGQTITNTAVATFDNPATGALGRVEAVDKLWVNSAQLSVLKRSDAPEYQIGDIATFTLSIANTTAGSVARNVLISDNTMDDCVLVDFDSIEVTGVPDVVFYPVDGNGAAASEQRDAGWTLTEVGNGFELLIPYLPSDALVTVSYTAECTQDSNGLGTVNTAVVTVDNGVPGSEEVEASTSVWTNEASLTLSKNVAQYENQVGEAVHYTLLLANLASGTVAKDVVVEDVALPEGFNLVEDSISFVGVPETVSFPFDDESEDATELRENACNVEVVEGGFRATIAYLPAGTPASISYDVIPRDAVNGSEIVNAASLTCANSLDSSPATDEALVWINSPTAGLTKMVVDQAESYRPGDIVTYRVALENTATGTVAHDVVISDSFQADGLELIAASVASFDDSGEAIEGAQLEVAEDNSGFTLAVPADLVCTGGNYSIWRERQEEVQEAFNPAGQTQYGGIVVEYQATVTDAALSSDSIANLATAEGANVGTSALDEVSIDIDTDYTSDVVGAPGDGSGDGSGSGLGDGLGDGSGSGSGDGLGDGSGDGSGSGSGSGVGDGLGSGAGGTADGNISDRGVDSLGPGMGDGSGLGSAGSGADGAGLGNGMGGVGSNTDGINGALGPGTGNGSGAGDGSDANTVLGAATGDGSDKNGSNSNTDEGKTASPEGSGTKASPKTSTSSSTKTSGSTANTKSGLTKTGDYLRTHPFVIAIVVSGIVATISWRRSTSQRSRMRRRIRTM